MPITAEAQVATLPRTGLRTTCLINHYDYGEYIAEAVQSVLAQTRPVDEIVLVDDGSSPDHLTRVREAATLDPRIQLVEQPNGGQLACFQTGIARSSGDLVFFLDADDRWARTYVERVHELYTSRPEIDFVVTQEAELDSAGRLVADTRPSRDLGYSAVLCHEGRSRWVGGPTSCISMRRKILDRIFPVPDTEALRICADETLVYGASIVGARKFFLGEPLVHYRVHGQNNFFGRGRDPYRDFQRRFAANQLVAHLRQKVPLPDSLAAIAHYEFCTIERPTPIEYRDYRRLVWRSKLSFGRKVRVAWGLFSRFRFGRMM